MEGIELYKGRIFYTSGDKEEASFGFLESPLGYLLAIKKDNGLWHYVRAEQVFGFDIPGGIKAVEDEEVDQFGLPLN